MKNCKGCEKTVPAPGERFCNTCRTEKIHAGHTREELSNAFDAVKDSKNWKRPIDGIVSRRNFGVTAAAVAFFAGSALEIVDEDWPEGGERMLRVWARGYFADIGA